MIKAFKTIQRIFYLLALPGRARMWATAHVIADGGAFYVGPNRTKILDY